MGNAIVKALLEKDLKTRVDENWSLPEMVQNVISDVGRHLSGNKAIASLLAMLGPGSSDLLSSAPLEEHCKYISDRYGKIDKSDPHFVLAFMRNFVSETAMIERKAIAYGACRIKDISADELVMLSDPFIPLATDRFWYKWFKELVIPFELLTADQKEQRKKELADIMSEYDYTIIRKGKRISWAEAFPQEISDMCDSIARMESLIGDHAIKSYLEKVRKAFMCSDINDLEQRWEDVDHAWIRIPNDMRVFPVHGMEAGYEHAYGVSPEWRIMVRSEFGEKEIDDIRSAMPEIITPFGADADLLREKMEKIDIGTFYTAVWAGTCMNFRYAGQAVPNRQNVLEKGGKIFMDLDSLALSVEKYKELIDLYVEGPAVSVLKDRLSHLLFLETTAGHEIAHPAGRSKDIDGRLGGGLKLLEEAKATMCGLLAIERICPQKRLAMAAETVARICRFFHRSKLNDTTSIQYVWENMVACRTMAKAGVIKVSEGRIKVDIEKAQSRDWFMELEDFSAKVLKAYQEGDAEFLKKMKKEMCDQENGIIAEVIALVNKE